MSKSVSLRNNGVLLYFMKSYNYKNIPKIIWSSLAKGLHLNHFRQID